MPAAFPPNESARLAALRDFHIVDTPPEAAFDRIVHLACRVLHVPMAAVSLVESDRQWYKASVGMAPCEASRDVSFCAHAILEDDVFVVADATADPRFVDNPFVTTGIRLRFYAGAALRTPEGQVLGALCVADHHPRRFGQRERETLKDLAAMVVAEMTLRVQNENLKELHASIAKRVAEATEGLTRTNRELSAVIGQRELADEESRRHERRFQQIFDQMSDAAFFHDAEGRLIDVNVPACTSLGCTREELMAMSIYDVIVGGRPEELTRMWREIPPGQARTVEERHRRRDGSSFPVEARLCALETPEGRRIIALVRDVTEQVRHSELLATRARQQQVISQLGLKALRDTAHQGEDGLDALLAEAITLVGQALETDVGCVMECLAEPGRFCWRATYGWEPVAPGTVIDLGDAADSMAGYILAHAPVVVNDFHTEIRFLVPAPLLQTGMRSSISTVIYTEGKSPFGIMSMYSRPSRQFTADDITFLQAVANVLAAAITRQRVEGQVQRALTQASEARRTAEKANEAKSLFLSRISHELRTPLNAILGFGQVLEMSPLDEQETASVKYILQGGRHLLSLVDEVLDLTRAESGELRLVCSQVNVGALAQECLDLVARMAQAREITCRVEMACFPAAVWCDESRLRQVLLNLISNAIKYNREGGQVVVACEAMPGNRRRLKVIDTGSGLSPEEINHLFVPFERLTQAYGAVEGTGLGLVVSRRVAEAMGGSLGLESEVGRGSTFWVELPGVAVREAAAVAPVPDHEPPVSPAAADSVRLLYIEDNASNLQVMQSLLARCRPQWELLSATNGVRGLERARQDAPDLVLLDLQLPGLPGDRLLAELRRDPATRGIPVIVLSADATPHSRAQLLAQGANDYLTKPFQLDGLLTRLDHFLSVPAVRPHLK